MRSSSGIVVGYMKLIMAILFSFVVSLLGLLCHEGLDFGVCARFVLELPNILVYLIKKCSIINSLIDCCN